MVSIIEFMSKLLPKIGIVCDVIQFVLNQLHVEGEKYINAVDHGAKILTGGKRKGNKG